MSDDDAWVADETYDASESVSSDEVNFAVRLQGVSRRYSLGKRDITALSNITLEIGMGDFVAITGASGSGKTTLLNIIGAIDYATEGRVFVMDVPIGDYDESFRATFRLSNTGFIFQSYNLISTLTALENVMFPMQLTDKSLEEIQNDSLKLLERVGLAERTDHLPWQLSSGEQQRVAIARAMSNDPPIILADEPTANLDTESAKMVRDLLQSLHQSGKAVIVMTHDTAIVRTKGARHLIMADGVLSSNV
ncbi:MAG: ABC transporter ATP-binding protein [Candidatus Thorarchaeota archaeon]|jgi:putative ABC transport system ATP-binding protein